ncbi:MAG TPA: ParB/RepB/Spo0J family partition protein [Candidatus Binataceae bacterium]|jgi:ParB family chromosome partitioning protein|nr:ParB/RepB/Spo0J family partition protein [Candidatus Binataceae bacterium]
MAEASEIATFPRGARRPAAIDELANAIEADGGAALAAYREPIGDHWQLFALIPAAMLKPTPFQRDLSPAHIKRLGEVMKKLDRFTEPVVVVRHDGAYWTPNGNHRRAAATKLGARTIPAIVIPEPAVAFQILALNTEKAHNLKDKALEVIRMYRARLEAAPRTAEKEYAFEFERAYFVTLGLLYDKTPRFSGGVYAPLLSRVDNFMAKPMREAMEERAERAAQVAHADEVLGALVARAQKRGLTHPYLKNYIVARCNPLTRARKNLPACRTALNSLVKALEEFDLGRIHFGQVQSAAQLVAAATVEHQ